MFSQFFFQNPFPKIEACQSTAFCLADTRYQASRLDEFSHTKPLFFDKFSVTKPDFTDRFLHTQHHLFACQVQVPFSYPGGAHVTTAGVTTSPATKETIPLVDLLGTDITDQITVDPTATSSGTGHPPGDRDRDRDRDRDGDRDKSGVDKERAFCLADTRYQASMKGHSVRTICFHNFLSKILFRNSRLVSRRRSV